MKKRTSKTEQNFVYIARFDPYISSLPVVAQMVERLLRMREVEGSSPGASIFFSYQYYSAHGCKIQLCTGTAMGTAVDVYLYGFCFKIKELWPCGYA